MQQQHPEISRDSSELNNSTLSGFGGAIRAFVNAQIKAAVAKEEWPVMLMPAPLGNRKTNGSQEEPKLEGPLKEADKLPPPASVGLKSLLPEEIK